jgi:hypothetical protein
METAVSVSNISVVGVDVGETMREDWGTAADVVDLDGYTITLFQRPG